MAAAPPKKSAKGFGARMTAKVGPLPVWGWALLVLAAGYLVYRMLPASSSSTSPANAGGGDSPSSPGQDAGVNDSQTTPAGAADSGSPPSSGQGGPADNLSSDLFGQLSGLQGSIDGLTQLLQSSDAFGFNWSGDSGSGSTVPNDGTHSSPLQTTTPAATPTKTTKPAATPRAPAKVHYYTYAPGKAPKGKAKLAAPARGPAGTKLHFTRGKGYSYQ